MEGCEDEPYLISITIDSDAVKDADCTCPYMEEWEGWCKHIAAAMLFCWDNPAACASLGGQSSGATPKSKPSTSCRMDLICVSTTARWAGCGP